MWFSKGELFKTYVRKDAQSINKIKILIAKEISSENLLCTKSAEQIKPKSHSSPKHFIIILMKIIRVDFQ